MSGQYTISFTDPAKGTFVINSLETEGPGSLNTVPIVTANSGVGGNFAVSGDFTPRFIPGFAFSVINSLVAPPNDGAYIVSTSVFQGTTAINTISNIQKKFVLNGVDYTAIFTPGRIFKVVNSQTPISNNGYWIVASSAFVAGNTEITISTTVPSGYRGGLPADPDDSGLASTPIVSAVANPTNTFTVTGNQTAYFTPAFAFNVTGTPSNNGGYIVLSSTYNLIQNQTIITVTTPVPANQGAIGNITFTLVTGSIVTNLTVILPTVAVPTTAAFPDGDITYTLVGNTSLTLPGRGTVNYGFNIIEDLVHMLENFYFNVAPSNPTMGQLWFDSFSNTLKVYDNSATFVDVTGGGGAPAQPLNQVVYGTGGSISSDPDFMWVPLTNVMTLGSTATPATIKAPDGAGIGANLTISAGDDTVAGTGGNIDINAGDSVTGTPGILNIFGGSTGGSNNGGDINIIAGDAGVFNNGGFVFITSGTSALGNAGGVIITGAAAPSQGGTIFLNAGNGGTIGGNLSFNGGSATISGNGGNIDITSGNSINGNTGGQLTLTSGNGLGVNANGGPITVTGGSGTGTGNGSTIQVRIGVSSATGQDGTLKVAAFGGYIQHQGYNFAMDDDSRTCQYLIQNLTTNNTITELFIDGTNGFSRRMKLADNSTWNFEIKVVARRTDATDESFAVNFEGSIDRQVGVATTALVGGILSIPLADDSGGVWTVLVDADTTNGALRVQVTGEIGKTIRWTAFVRTVEVTN